MWSPTWAVTVRWLSAFVTRTLPGGGVGDGGPPDPAALPHAATMTANATAISRAFMRLERQRCRQVPAAVREFARDPLSAQPGRRGPGCPDRRRHPGRHRDPRAGREAGLLELGGGRDHRLVPGGGREAEHRRARKRARTIGRD